MSNKFKEIKDMTRSFGWKMDSIKTKSQMKC